MKLKNCTLSLLVLFTSIIYCSCKKDEDLIKEYKMEYLVKINDDPKVSYLSVSTWTIFPNENENEYLGETKYKYDMFDSEANLNDIDSIYISPELLVYPGCTSYMKVRLYFSEGSKKYSRYRDYYFGTDTISKKSDSKLIFNWPEDSAKAEYEENYCLGCFRMK